MSKKAIPIIFFILLLASTASVIADEEHEHDDHEGVTLTLNGYEIGLAMEPESPKVGEVHLVVHIESDGENISGLHVEIQIAKMEMHSGEMEEHIVLPFEEAHEEENESGHYALHHMFEEEGTYMIRVKIEDIGATDDAFHITVGSSFHKGEVALPLFFIAIGIGGAALMVGGVKTRGT